MGTLEGREDLTWLSLLPGWEPQSAVGMGSEPPPKRLRYEKLATSSPQKWVTKPLRTPLYQSDMLRVIRGMRHTSPRAGPCRSGHAVLGQRASPRAARAGVVGGRQE